MASLYTHLAIAKRYMEKHPGEIMDAVAFYDGNVLPDFDTDKENSHYGKRGESKDLIKRHQEKISLAKFLELNKLDNDLNKGKLLHLYADWLYYNELLPHDYLRTIDLEQFMKDNIYTAHILYDPYLEKKYNLNYGMTSVQTMIEDALEKWHKKDEERWGKDFKGHLLFTKEQLDAFIEQASSTKIVDIVASKITTCTS